MEPPRSPGSTRSSLANCHRRRNRIIAGIFGGGASLPSPQEIIRLNLSPLPLPPVSSDPLSVTHSSERKPLCLYNLSSHPHSPCGLQKQEKKCPPKAEKSPKK
eukprot:RCo045790